MKRISKIILPCLLLAYIFMPSWTSIWAMPEDLYVKTDMSFGEVLKILGPPKSKQVMETKRKDIWTYSTQKIVFKEGKVFKIESTDPKIVDAPSKQAVKASKTKEEKLSAKKRTESANEADMILKDLADAK